MKGIWKKMFTLFFVIALIVFLYIYREYTNYKNTVIFSQDTLFEIKKGDTYRNIYTDLSKDTLYTKIFLKHELGNPPHLQKGEYFIPAGVKIKELFQYLQTPYIDQKNITILEGWNIYDIDIILTQQELIQAGEFVKYVTDCEYFCKHKNMFAFIADTESLEGFLYPDTYAVTPQNFTIENLVGRMLANFQTKVIDSGIISDMGSIEILDVINMASIVQKEVNFSGKSDEEIYQEAATISGILGKRLQDGWRIDADATVCYAHGIATQDCNPQQVLRYLYDKNEYNTRQSHGLPRSAISNPEARIIQAVVSPIQSPYYFYLHAADGKIYYARTNAEHDQNKRKYLR